MRGKKYFTVLVISTIFLFTLAAAIVPVKAQLEPYVKVYVDQPLGYIEPPSTDPADYPWWYFTVDIMIEAHGFTEATGIIGWGMDIQFNPAVHDPSYATAYGAQTGYCIYDFWKAKRLPAENEPVLALGARDATTGYWDELAESMAKSPTKGVDDVWTAAHPLLVRLEFDCNTWLPALIDLIDVEYRTVDGLWHAVDVVIDGFYGERPRYMSYQGSILPSGDPSSTDWHELYPDYSHMWHLQDWTDNPANPDGELSASDQIHMTNETGWIFHFHVDAVTVTIHWTFKPDGTTPDPSMPGDAEPFESHLVPVDQAAPSIRNPIDTTWHQLYPEYCREFVITSHEDTDEDGTLDVSEQFDFEYLDEPGVTYWAHLDDITTDILLSLKEPPEPPVLEFPFGIGLIMALAPIIPLIYLWRRKGWKK